MSDNPFNLLIILLSFLLLRVYILLIYKPINLKAIILYIIKTKLLNNQITFNFSTI